MFGIDNVGVINQRNAPAIWTSPIADFPPNNIQGRLLLATDTVTLYVDLINGTGGVTNRAIVASGLINDGSGTTINNTGTGDYSVDLGGKLLNSVTIENCGFDLLVSGSNDYLIFNSAGYLTSNAYGALSTINEVSLSVVTPNCRLILSNPSTGDTYYILAQNF